MKKPIILIVEDEKSTREGLEKALASKYEIRSAETGETALTILSEEPVDLVLTDLRMPGMGGMELLKRCNQLEKKPLCIMLTAYGSIESAVEAMRAGAADFLTKPINLDQLEIVIERVLKTKQLEEENIILKSQLDKKYGLEGIIGSTPVMEELFELIRQVAPTRSTVLIQGEIGTGKELVANAIHRLSPRKNGPFIAVHCAALPQQLLESELFGHEKGAFTGAHERRKGRFELAQGGTLFLDEISEIEPSIQVKLLRVLEERKFERIGGHETLEADIRLLAATNRNLEEMVAKKQFREDLFYRLNVVTISLPPLRERKDDIPMLVNHFLKEYSKENGRHIEGITPEAMNLLMAYSWPGNVRELRNVIERMVVLARTPKLTIKDLPANIRASGAAHHPPIATQSSSLAEANRQMIIAALKMNNGNRTEAAKQLGISRRTLQRKLHEYGLFDIPEIQPKQKNKKNDGENV